MCLDLYIFPSWMGMISGTIEVINWFVSEITDIKKRLLKIEARNHRVELDKAWETSWTRRFIILIFSYVLIGLYLNIIHVTNPWLNAITPSLGFLLSTLTIAWVKNIWLNRQ